jgi:hypothetical protein
VGGRCRICAAHARIASNEIKISQPSQSKKFLLNTVPSDRAAMAAMADVAYPLHEEEIEALAHYLAHL